MPKAIIEAQGKQLLLVDLIMHIIIKNTTWREIKASKAKEVATRANMV